MELTRCENSLGKPFYLGYNRDEKRSLNLSFEGSETIATITGFGGGIVFLPLAELLEFAAAAKKANQDERRRMAKDAKRRHSKNPRSSR